MTATILFADDNDEFRGALATVLEEHDFNVVQARSPWEALAAFASGVAIDVVISDVSLPSGAPAPLLAELRRYAAPLPLIYVSGFPLDEAARRYAMRPGAQFLAKPFSATALVAAIWDAMGTPTGPTAA